MNVIHWLLFLLFATAQAEELQFDFIGTAYTPNNEYYPGVGPIDISFMLDTMSGTSIFVFPAQGSCLQSFVISGASFSNVSVSVNGQSMMSGNFVGGMGGTNFMGGCPGYFFAGLNFGSNSSSLFLEFDPQPAATQANLLASTDPLGTLFAGFDKYNLNSGADFLSPSGELNIALSNISVRSVSVTEPGLLTLFLLGLTGIALSRWRVSP